jgi:neutral ceramidase
VMRIDDAAGKPYAVVVNFQCHGTVLGYENKIASPDWIGALRQTVEQAFPGALCVYLQGAAGNQGPIEGYSGDLAVAHRLGATLGHQAAAVALGIETVVREPRFEGFVESTAYQARQPWRVRGPRDSTLRFMHRTLELPRRQYSAAEIDEMARLHDDAQQKAAAAKSSGDAWRVHQAEARARRIGDLLAKWKRPADPTPVKLGVNVLRVGELALVATAGEPFAEIGAAVKKASPFAVTMFAGYSSLEGGGYMPVESEYAHGGYEVQMTPYAAGAAEKLVRDIAALYSQIR